MFVRQKLEFWEVTAAHTDLLLAQRATAWEGYRDPYPVFPGDHEKWLKSLSRVNQAFVARDPSAEGNQYVGLLRISGFDFENHSVGITGVDVFEHARSHGYAPRIVRAGIEYAVQELNMHRVWAQAMATNVAMLKALAEAGMKTEGKQRKAIWRHGAYHDFVQVSILAEEL
jgi:RimJ/RimL family protein N-acetyltransferase